MMLTVSTLQVDSLKKGFDGFDKEGGTINQTTMMMILKSMGVDVNKVSRPCFTPDLQAMFYYFNCIARLSITN